MLWQIHKKEMINPEMAFPVSCKLFFITLIILLLPILTTAQSRHNITLDSFIVADNSNSTWKSPSGEFAFGFRQVAPGGYLLAIWFDEIIPDKTIIWSANRDNLAKQGSIIQLFADGRFELSDPNGQLIWSANFIGSGVAYGAMLDSGNFVLARNSSSFIWQSFDEPTDTLLPSQTLDRGRLLVSSFSATNYSRRKFTFAMQPDGNLVLYTRNFPSDEVVYPYWSTATVGSGFRLIFNQSGYIYLATENGTVLNALFSNGALNRQFYQRLILEYDGVLRHYVYPRSARSTAGRPMAWSVSHFLPSNVCIIVKEEIGGGICGLNGYCRIGTDERIICDCPFGYSRVDPNDGMAGCKPDFVMQSCIQQSEEIDHFTLRDMPNTDWVGGHYAHFRQVSEDDCRQDCLGDCFCAVAIFKDGNCWKKTLPFINGRNGPSLQLKALVKVRKDNATTLSPTGGVNPSKSSHRSALIIAGSVLLGSSVFLNLLLFFVFRLNRRKSSKMIQAYTVLPGVNIRSFSFNELQEATNGFKEELGRGACSTVYKGFLEDENGKLIAVKKLDKIAREAEQEFKAEVSSISKTNHKNLVRLLGYCEEGQNRLLVYEFMCNGSLADFLFEKSRPNWYRRIQIAFATARGLCYLHEECSSQIIHCDIKPQNVLLDESHTAKISDFGLAKLLRPDQTRTITGIRGTRGYVAPEWFRNMPITVKVDVYSFGILLLELICCRKNVERNAEDESEMVLADWAYDCFKEGTLRSLVVGDEEAIDDIKRFEKFVMIAIWCTQEDPALRPNMKRVMHMLEGSIDVPIPPDPVSFVS